ncbi:MAG: hypothetical protein ACFCUO_01085 [Rhodospirillales bacterium]
MSPPSGRPAILAAALALAVLWPAGGQPADGFVAAIGDLPLMPGLAENADAGIVFDTPSGRIVQTEATGRVSRDGVLRFYSETLPQLGWRPLAAGLFRRGNELLKIDVDETDDPPATVRFALSPTGDRARP